MSDRMIGGPYVLVSQFKTEEFEKNPFTFKDFIKTDKFELRLGYATYAVGEDFHPVMVGYNWDTSD